MENLRAELAKSNKKSRDCARIYNQDGKYLTTVVKTIDGMYSLHANMGCYTTSSEEDLEKEFIDAYLRIMEEKQITAEQKAEEARMFERNRITELKEKIESCSTPRDLADFFELSIIESANHWNELYNGKSKFAVKITSAAEAEIMELAKDIFNIEGEYVEFRHRAGEHHWQPFPYYFDLKDYQEKAKSYLFNQNDHFYKSQESEEEFLMERIKEVDTLEEVRELIEKHDELEAGIYDHNGTLIITEEYYESKDFSGYGYDGYTYQFGFVFEGRGDDEFNQVGEED